MAEFVMPMLGADMEAGTLALWLRKPGETIKRGEVIAEIDTDKGLIEVECFTSGVIESLLITPGEKVPVGTVMAIIRAEGEAAGAAPSDAKPTDISLPTAPTPTVPASLAQSAPVSSSPAAGAERLHISPTARKLAEELGVGLASVKGTGPGGRITRADIERAAAGTKATIEPETRMDRRARMRQAIAAAMARSKREIPHYYLSTTIDVSRVMTWLAEADKERSVTSRLLSGVLLIKAVALALREFPELNATWETDQAILKKDINIGVAISLRQGGLTAPALHNADQQSLDEL